ncbi:F-box domain-containing protein [Mycena chlorophos]|uniref:F-box domain-containing protein n=1 Tax=Mycena chlorophos TaxID=658473 RepID=A0A8H6S1N4_MYCCL|nr:F-box domain-containing protein [Mycena chlorophos]
MSICSNCAAPTPARSSTLESLRARLDELDLLLKALNTERNLLLAESQAVTYPVLTLPNEITTQIFLHCVESDKHSDGHSRPNPADSPLLLTRVCSSWRAVALNTPALWSQVAVRNELPPEILTAWLQHATPLPLDLYIFLNNPEPSSPLIDVCIAHAKYWRIVSCCVPSIEYLRLKDAFDHPELDLPLLSEVKFSFTHSSSADRWSDEILAVRRAPALKKLEVLTPPQTLAVLVDWSQLTHLRHLTGVRIGTCLEILAQCLALEELALETYCDEDLDKASIVSFYRDTPIILPHLRQLSCLLQNAQSPLLYLTLPALVDLTTRYNGVEATATILSAFFRRSAPPLRRIHLSVDDFPIDALLQTLDVLPSSVETAEFSLGRNENSLSQLLGALAIESSRGWGFRAIPALRKLFLHLQVGPIEPPQYEALLALLRVRSQVVHVEVHHRLRVVGPDWGIEKPSKAVVEAFRELGVSRGLQVKVRVLGMISRPFRQPKVWNFGA